MTISQRIFERLHFKSSKPSDLAKYTGISPKTISDWKLKGSNPTSEKLCVIAEFLDVSLDYLLTGKDLQKDNLLPISEDKQKLLEMYDLLTDREQGEIIGELKERTKDRQVEKGQDLVG